MVITTSSPAAGAPAQRRAARARRGPARPAGCGPDSRPRWRAEQELVAALLDQRAGDRIGVAIFRRPVQTPLVMISSRTRRGKPFHISFSVKSGAGAISTSPARTRPLRRRAAMRAPAAAPSSRPSTSRSRPADPGRAARTPPRSLPASGRWCRRRRRRRFAVARIVEPDAGAAVLRGPGVQRERLGAAHVGIEAAEPEQPRRTAGAGAHRDPAAAIALADLDKGRFLLDGAELVMVLYLARLLCPRARGSVNSRPRASDGLSLRISDAALYLPGVTKMPRI